MIQSVRLDKPCGSGFIPDDYDCSKPPVRRKASHLQSSKETHQSLQAGLKDWQDYLAKQKRKTKQQKDAIFLTEDINRGSRSSIESIRAVRDNDGVLQATALIAQYGQTTKVDYLLTAPWNLSKKDPQKIKGSGTEIMINICKEAWERGDKKIELNSIPESIPFYKKLGFRYATGEKQYLNLGISPKMVLTRKGMESLLAAKPIHVDAEVDFEEIIKIEDQIGIIAALKVNLEQTNSILSDTLPHSDRSASDHPEFYYSNKTGRYHYRDTNKFVSSAARDNLTRGHINQTRETLRNQTDRLNQISFTRWQKETFTQIKIAHTQSYMLGRGGIHEMQPQDYAALSKEMRFQRDRFKLFSGQILDGKLSDAAIRYRLTAYGEATKVSHENGLMMAAKARGATEERNVLGRSEHCPDCVKYTGMGWQPIGTLPRPTKKRQCMYNCQCRMEFRGVEEQLT